MVQGKLQIGSNLVAQCKVIAGFERGRAGFGGRDGRSGVAGQRGGEDRRGLRTGRVLDRHRREGRLQQGGQFQQVMSWSWVHSQHWHIMSCRGIYSFSLHFPTLQANPGAETLPLQDDALGQDEGRGDQRLWAVGKVDYHYRSSYLWKFVKFSYKKLKHWLSQDLVSDDVMILDSGAEIYVWVGKGADEEGWLHTWCFAKTFLEDLSNIIGAKSSLIDGMLNISNENAAGEA